MRFILITVKKQYKIVDVADDKSFNKYIEGFLVVDKLTHACLEGRVPKGIFMVRREHEISLRKLSVNEYGTKLVNKNNIIERYIFDNIILIQRDDANKMIDMNDLYIMQITEDLRSKGYREV